MDINGISTVKKQVLLSGEESNLEVTLTSGEKLYVPPATDNTDYQAILEWVADGNTIAEAD